MAIAILTGRTGSLQSIGMLLLFVAVFILICEHVIPMFIVRRDPERVLEVLLPPFDVAARFVQPLTRALVGLVVDARRDRLAAAAVAANGGSEDASEAPGADETRAKASGAWKVTSGGCCSRSSTSATRSCAKS